MAKKRLNSKLKKVITFLFALLVLISVPSVPMPQVKAAQIYSWGSYGETVKTIQTKLKRWGYYSGSVDGIFGYKTYESVLYFQRSNGLKADGIVGTKTLEALGIYQTAVPLKTAAATPAPSTAAVKTPAAATPTPKTAEPVKTPEPTETPQSDGQSSKEADIWLIAKVINGESRGESYLGQVAVGAVIMNRVKSPAFPNTIYGVIFQAGAFDAIRDGQFDLTPLESCVNAARDAYNGWDPVDGAVFYWNPNTATSKWIQTLTVTKTIGNHVFAMN